MAERIDVEVTGKSQFEVATTWRGSFSSIWKVVG
jgi:hypothetical protein